jgi:Flp pilus assembly protein TadD
MLPSPDSSEPPRFAAIRRGRLTWRPSPRALVLAALILVLAGIGGFLVWRRSPQFEASVASPPPDPRRTYTGPFRNIRPDIAYVGDAACGQCHFDDKIQAYHEHPMGRSLAPIGDRLGELPEEGSGGFTAFHSRFDLERRGERLWHRQTRLDAAGQPIYTLDHEVRYVIGSGTRGYSFLSEREGYLFQTPISWFSQKRVWGLSPGFTLAQLPGRPVAAECLYCHANRARPRPNTVNGYETPIFEGHAIGCERCHGPGEQHVQERSRTLAVEGAFDDTIFNPSKKYKQVAPALRDSVCEQCHLSGEVRVLRRGRDLYDFRPGLPLQEIWSVFVGGGPAEGNAKAVNHVEQMHLSRCYRESSGTAKLECVSCHNPHERVPAPERVSSYRARCLKCHETQGCTLPREQRLRERKDDSCIDCHMPRYSASDIPHTAATDHRIVRRRDPSPGDSRDKLLFDSLQSFYRDRAGAADQELARDRGVALARLAAEGKGEAQRLARQALDLLREALAAWPDDVPVWEARGAAFTVLKQPAEALSAFERALDRAPQREYSLHAAAQLAQEIGNRDKALDYWRRAAASDPQAPDYHGNLALLLAHTGAWEPAREQCQIWLRLDPGSLEARKLWIRCLRQQGERRAARDEMDRLRRLNE